MMTTMERATEKTINIVGDKTSEDMAIKGCEANSRTTTASTKVCFLGEEQFVDGVPPHVESIVCYNADRRGSSPTRMMVEEKEKVSPIIDDDQAKPKQQQQQQVKEERVDDFISQSDDAAVASGPSVTEDIIEGFAFASFANYDDLEEWVRREEEKLRLLLQRSDSGGDNGGTNALAKTARSSNAATPDATPTPKKRCKRNKENKMAMLAMALKETDCGASTVSATVKQFDSASSVFETGANNSIANNANARIPDADSTSNQHSPQPVVSVLDGENSSPSLLRPKSSSAIADLSSMTAGQSTGNNSITSARVKRQANSIVCDGSAQGDHATDLSVPAKVPKRETVVPGTAASELLQEHQQTQDRILSPPRARSNASETSDTTKRSGVGLVSTTTSNSKKIQSQQQLIAVANRKLDPMSPSSYVSGNLCVGDKMDETTSYLMATTIAATSSSTSLVQAGSTKAAAATSSSASISGYQQQQPPHGVGSELTLSHLAGGGKNVTTQGPNALFPPIGAGLFSTPGSAAGGGGVPAYFHTEMHQHQHTHMHQYPPFLPPFLGAAAAAAGLPGMSGMVGLSPAYGNLPGFSMNSQVPGLPPSLSTQMSNANAAQGAPKKKGKWCAMHVQIAWDIHNKTALRRERKTDDGGGQSNHNAGASTSAVFTANSVTTTGSNSNSSSSTGPVSSHRHSAVRSAGIPTTPSQNVNNSTIEKSKSLATVDPNREQRRREREKEKQLHQQQKSNSVQRSNDVEIINRINSVQNGGGQSASGGGGRESTKLPIDQRYNNGTSGGSSHRASSTIPPSPSATTLPLKTEQPNSLPLFQDGLLLRQQQLNSYANSVGVAVSTQASTNSMSTAAAAAAADGMFRSAAAAMGMRGVLPPPHSMSANYSTTPTYNNSANLALAANLAAVAERLRPMTPSSQGAANASLDAAYRTLMGLDGGRGVGYDSALFRPPLMLDPLMFEREREQFLRLQQQQFLNSVAVNMHQDHHGNSASSNPLASMIDLERAMSRPAVMSSSAAPGLVTQSPITSAVPHSTAALAGLPQFNHQLLGGMDGATAAALYSSGLFQRERMELEQQVRLMGAAAGQGQGMPGAAPNAGALGNNVDPLRLGFLGAAGNPMLDPFFTARMGNAAGFPNNLGLNFGLGPGSSTPSMSSNHLPTSSNVHGNMFSNSLEQLARQKRDVLLASAAAAAAGNANVFQNR